MSRATGWDLTAFDLAERLSSNQLAAALNSWSLGKSTYDIHKALGIPEYVVANTLAEERDRRWMRQRISGGVK